MGPSVSCSTAATRTTPRVPWRFVTSEDRPGRGRGTAYLAVRPSFPADVPISFLFVAISLVLLPAMAAAAILALLLLGDPRPLLPAGLVAAGLVLTIFLVPLAGAGNSSLALSSSAWVASAGSPSFSSPLAYAPSSPAGLTAALPPGRTAPGGRPRT